MFGKYKVLLRVDRYLTALVMALFIAGVLLGMSYGERVRESILGLIS